MKDMKRIYFINIITIYFIILALIIVGCKDNINIISWPNNYTEIFKKEIVDEANDCIKAPDEAPPYNVTINYSSIDVTKVYLGVTGNYLYMRLDFNGNIPVSNVSITANGEVENQIVMSQGTNVAFDVDNNDNTGLFGEELNGMDIFFAYTVIYDSIDMAYAKYDFPTANTTDESRGHLDGEVGPGGPGYNYVIIRYNISNLGNYFPIGNNAEIGAWSEAQSNLYHHYAFDRVSTSNWIIQ